MKKLFEVTIEKTIYVLADDEYEAELEAKTYEGEEDADNVMASEVRGIDQIPEDYRDTLPYGNDEGPEQTLRQIMEAPLPPPPPYNDPNQMKLEFPK